MSTRPARWLLGGLLVAVQFVHPTVGDACGTPDTKKRLEKLLSPEQLARLDHHMDFTLVPYSIEAAVPCVDGTADVYSCERVDLMAVIQPPELGSTAGNDIWGWTDPKTSREYALIGLRNGVAFVDVTDPENPSHVGSLPSHGGVSNTSAWRDVKVYGTTAYVVQDYPQMPHGLQVFDLTRLRSVTSTPTTFTEDHHIQDFARSHNLVINEASGFLYAVGTESSVCSGGLTMYDLSNPIEPDNAGCFSGDGYTHDAQCVIYQGPDADHVGDEICFASNEDTVTIVDVTDKKNPVQLSRTPYDNVGYSHQGWLTEDHRYFVHDDESDELAFGHNSKTRVFDVSDLDHPVAAPSFLSHLPASDHNLYIVGDFAYQANYRAGLRILWIDPDSATLHEVAHFDTYPDNDHAATSGAWSVYPFFASGTVLVSDINRGLFILRPDLENLVLPQLFADGFESGDTTAW